MFDATSGKTVGKLWDEAARTFGTAEFLVFRNASDREFHFTYQSFNERINQAAHAFRQWGIKKGDVVVVHMCNSIDFLLCLFSLAKLGAIMVPMNERNVADECAYVLEKCTPRLLVTEPDFLALYDELKKRDSVHVPKIVCARTETDIEGTLNFYRHVSEQPTTFDSVPDIAEDDTVEVMFTSGTTSKPKGVELTHANLLYAGMYTVWQTQMTADDRLLTTMPACHSNFQLAALMPVIYAGATLVLIEKYSAHRFWRQVQEYKATIIQCVSMMVRTLMKQPVRDDEKNHRVREILYFLPLDTPTKDAFEARFNVRLMNSYGSTESLNWVITDLPTGERRWPSVGRVGLGYEVRLVDDDGNDVPCGVPGEVLVRGVPGRTIAKGYFRDSEMTARTFIDHQWLRTGDKCTCDEDGFFYFVDRKSNMIKRSGENISASEIETVLEHDDRIAEAAVIGRPDPIRDQMVVAFVVPAAGASIDEQDVIDICKAHLSSFKVPSVVEIRSSLPHTVSMKVEKKLLS